MFRSRLTDFTIRISTYYEMNDRQVQNILLHEMIHYYIAYTGKKDTSPHGVVFCEMMERLNRQYGWEMSISMRTKGLKVSKDSKKLETSAERLILALLMKDGKYFLSVVNPKYATRLEKQIKRVFEIQKHAWYVSDDNFFSDFPQVRSLRARKVSECQFNDFINGGAKPIEVLSSR